MICESNSIDRILAFQASCCWFKSSFSFQFGFITVCRPVWLGRLPWVQNVVGSNPATRTNLIIK